MYIVRLLQTVSKSESGMFETVWQSMLQYAGSYEITHNWTEIGAPNNQDTTGRPAIQSVWSHDHS